MRKIILIGLLIMYQQFLFAQELTDPAVNLAEIQPNPLGGLGSAFQVNFELANNGLDDVSGTNAANKVSFVISMSKSEPVFSTPGVITSALEGDDALALFDFTYNATTFQFTAVQKQGVVFVALREEPYRLTVRGRVTTLSADNSDHTVGASLSITANSSSTMNSIENDEAEALTRTTTVLPVDLVTFTASPNDCDVRLDWTTAMEEKFSHFVVERSVNGRDFTAVQNVKGKNSAAGSSYQLNVAGPNADGYYRLRMVDLDETYEFSPVIQVRTNCDTGPISIAPNPVTSSRIMVNGLRKPSSIKLFDLSGKLLQTVSTNKERQEVDLGNLPSGIYFIRIIQDDQLIKTSRLFKQ